MAKINVDPDEYAYIVFSYLFDKYLNFDEVSVGNESFNDVMMKLKGRLFPLSREMYLEQPAELRMKYKIIKKAFRNPTTQHSIFIVPKGESKEPKPGIIKKIIKKVIKMIKSSEEFSQAEVDYIKEQLEQNVQEDDKLNG